MKVKTESETRAEMLNCIVWAGICLMFLYALTGCGGHSRKYYFGYDVYDAGEESKSMNKPVKSKQMTQGVNE